MGDDRWTCSSDDDFAVSMRLEELQEENRRLSSQIRGGEQAAMVCSSLKEVTHPPCVVVNVVQREDKCSNEEDLLRVAGPRRHFDNLEIDPSAIVASCECVVNTPNESGTAPAGTAGPSGLAPAHGNEMTKTSTSSETPKPKRPRGRPPKSIQGRTPKSRSRKPAKNEGAGEPKKSRRPRKGNLVLSIQYCITANDSVYVF